MTDHGDDYCSPGRCDGQHSHDKGMDDDGGDKAGAAADPGLKSEDHDFVRVWAAAADQGDEDGSCLRVHAATVANRHSHATSEPERRHRSCQSKRAV